MATAASFLTIASSFSEPRTPISYSKRTSQPLQYYIPFKSDSLNRSKRLGLFVSSVSTPKVEQRTGPDDLIFSLLSSDGGVTLSPEQHKEVVQVAGELQKYCVKEPIKCLLIFGGWDVVYCSVQTSPGGGYRSKIGRLFFKTNEIIQGMILLILSGTEFSFTALGFLDGDVSLRGETSKLKNHSSYQIQMSCRQMVL